MNADSDEETGGSLSAGPDESGQESARVKICDLKPEKDPMGAVKKTASKRGGGSSSPTRIG